MLTDVPYKFTLDISDLNKHNPYYGLYCKGMSEGCQTTKRDADLLVCMFIVCGKHKTLPKSKQEKLFQAELQYTIAHNFILS